MNSPYSRLTHIIQRGSRVAETAKDGVAVALGGGGGGVQVTLDSSR